MIQRFLRTAVLAFVLLSTVSACAAPATTSTAPAPAAADTPGWPRLVETASGPVTIAAQPKRIHSLSLGFEEILLALVPPSRLSAVSTFALDPSLSNVVDLAKHVGKSVGRDPEAIIATEPDLVVASVTTRAELVDRLRAAGVPVLVSPTRESVEVLPQTIRWVAAVSGAEDNGERLIADVQARLARIDKLVSTKAESERPTAILFEDTNLFVAGAGATRDILLRRAGARNRAAEGGVVGDKSVSLEAIVAFDPSVVILQAERGNSAMRDLIATNPALQELSAVRNRRQYVVERRYLGSLSHWQVRGVEEIARQLWPELAGETFRDFQ